MKNVLFVASECVPFIKTGGLADVIGSLPKYIDKTKFDVRVIMPKYLCIPEKYRNKMRYVTHFYTDFCFRSQYVGVLEMEYEGVHFYFLDSEFYFGGPWPYHNMYEDIEKFAGKCGLEIVLISDSDTDREVNEDTERIYAVLKKPGSK